MKKKLPVLKFPDGREFICETISISATRLELEAGLQDVSVTAYGCFVETESGFRFMPHLQVHSISAYKPRPAGRPKPPQHQSSMEVFGLVQTSGPRHRREKKTRANTPGAKPSAPLNR